MPFALIVAATTIPLVHESKAHGDTRYDVPGVLLATTGLFSLVYGFTEAARLKNPDDRSSTEVQGWGDPSTLTFLILAVVLLVAFVVWERRARNPLLPLRVVLDRNRGGSFLVFLFVGAALYAMFLFLTYYFQVNLGYTPLEAGFAFLPFSLGIIIAAGFVSQLLPRVGPRALILPGLVMAIVGMLLLTQIDQDSCVLGAGVPRDGGHVGGPGRGLHPRGQHLPHRSRKPRRGRRLGDAQHLSTDRRLARHRAAEHGVRRRGHGLLHHQPTEQSRPGRADPPLAFIHGYHVAFFWGAALFACALIASIVLITAHKRTSPPNRRHWANLLIEAQASVTRTRASGHLTRITRLAVGFTRPRHTAASARRISSARRGLWQSRTWFAEPRGVRGRLSHVRVGGVLIITLVASFLAGCGDHSPGTTRDQSGVAGRVHLGPQCPVETQGDPCEDKPAAGSRVTVAKQLPGKSDAGVEVVARTTTDADGSYRVAVPPGMYVVTAQPACRAS